MLTVDELFTALGRSRITKEAGYGAQVLSRASTENVMPSGWFDAIERMCVADGIECPRHLFRFQPRPEPPVHASETSGAAS